MLRRHLLDCKLILYRNAKNSTAFKEAVKTFWQGCKQLQMQLAPQAMHPGHRFNY